MHRSKVINFYMFALKKFHTHTLINSPKISSNALVAFLSRRTRVIQFLAVLLN